jgi:4-diphosphocytidyl-2-C-methyl-D-erythritol kinase
VTDGAVRLTKTLPAAAGIGGGSADAAAALRLFEKALDRPRLATPETLGADVPACLLSRSLRMQGVGEHLTELPNIPPLWAILVNPGVEVATPDVFANLQSKENASHGSIPKLGTSEALITWLHEQRNDLEPPAIAVQPIIADILGAISALPDCQLARMSGSGATCFGLFPSEAAAVLAALLLQKDHPNWWVVQTRLGAAP